VLSEKRVRFVHFDAGSEAGGAGGGVDVDLVEVFGRDEPLEERRGRGRGGRKERVKEASGLFRAIPVLDSDALQ
jgi:hypothetical protein